MHGDVFADGVAGADLQPGPFALVPHVLGRAAEVGEGMHHAGFAELGRAGGLVAVHQRCRVGRGAFLGAAGIVIKDVIPFGSVWGNHAHLEGLNLVGLRRRGFTRETINTMRAAYRLLFADEGTFQERLDDTAETFSEVPEVMEIVAFIRVDGTRPLCLPKPD